MDHSSEMILKGYDDLESPPPSDSDDLPTPPPDDQDDDDDDFGDEYAGEYVVNDDDDDDYKIACDDGIDVNHHSKYCYLYPHGDEEDDDLPHPPPEDSEGKLGLDN